jgi:hypothetical protein
MPQPLLSRLMNSDRSLLSQRIPNLVVAGRSSWGGAVAASQRRRNAW